MRVMEKIIKTYFKKRFALYVFFFFLFFFLKDFLNMYNNDENDEQKGWFLAACYRDEVNVSNIIVCRNIKSVLVLLFYSFTAYSILYTASQHHKNKKLEVKFYPKFKIFLFLHSITFTISIYRAIKGIEGMNG